MLFAFGLVASAAVPTIIFGSKQCIASWCESSLPQQRKTHHFLPRESTIQFLKFIRHDRDAQMLENGKAYEDGPGPAQTSMVTTRLCTPSNPFNACFFQTFPFDS